MGGAASPGSRGGRDETRGDGARASTPTVSMPYLSSATRTDDSRIEQQLNRLCQGLNIPLTEGQANCTGRPLSQEEPSAAEGEATSQDGQQGSRTPSS